MFCKDDHKIEDSKKFVNLRFPDRISFTKLEEIVFVTTLLNQAMSLVFAERTTLVL